MNDVSLVCHFQFLSVFFSDRTIRSWLNAFIHHLIGSKKFTMASHKSSIKNWEPFLFTIHFTCCYRHNHRGIERLQLSTLTQWAMMENWVMKRKKCSFLHSLPLVSRVYQLSLCIDGKSWTFSFILRFMIVNLTNARWWLVAWSMYILTFACRLHCQDLSFLIWLINLSRTKSDVFKASLISFSWICVHLLPWILFAMANKDNL